MAEPSYHLVFRGEVLEGQEPAVVAKRLAALLKMEPAKAGALFSGRSVVLKRDAPKAVAAKYQAAFRKAGARLRVVPADADGAVAGAAAAASAPASEVPQAAAPQKKLSLAERLAAQEMEAADASAPAGVPSAVDGRPVSASVPDGTPGADAFSLAPATGDLVAEDERPRVVAVEVDVSHLSAAPAGTGSLEDVLEHLPPPPAPDVSGLSLAEAGADIGPAREEMIAAVAVPDIDLAEAGADIETLPAPPPPPVPDADFDVAALGADMAPERKPPAPPPPDVSHIELASDGRASFAVAD